MRKPWREGRDLRGTTDHWWLLQQETPGKEPHPSLQAYVHRLPLEDRYVANNSEFVFLGSPGCQDSWQDGEDDHWSDLPNWVSHRKNAACRDRQSHRVGAVDKRCEGIFTYCRSMNSSYQRSRLHRR